MFITVKGKKTYLKLLTMGSSKQNWCFCQYYMAEELSGKNTHCKEVIKRNIDAKQSIIAILD